jgi:hypothetical protein
MEKNTTGTDATKATNALGDATDFDEEQASALPRGWVADATGRGTATWLVAAGPSATSKQNVLKQSGIGTVQCCVRPTIAFTDGFVEVKFKPVSGDEDQADGVAWRRKDGDNCYVAHANALVKSVSLEYT